MLFLLKLLPALPLHPLPLQKVLHIQPLPVQALSAISHHSDHSMPYPASLDTSLQMYIPVHQAPCPNIQSSDSVSHGLRSPAPKIAGHNSSIALLKMHTLPLHSYTASPEIPPFPWQFLHFSASRFPVQKLSPRSLLPVQLQFFQALFSVPSSDQYSIVFHKAPMLNQQAGLIPA